VHRMREPCAAGTLENARFWKFCAINVEAMIR
jgi:hypothetical protein